jgi:cation-transporting ATPase E
VTAAVGFGGLTQAEAAKRASRGLDNRQPPPSARSYADIARDNVFTFINNVLFGLGLALVLLGRPTDALVSVGVVAVNLCVGVVQEVRAKRILDRIALLNRPTATVIRDGSPHLIDPAQVVLGELLLVGPGDQVVADGVVVGSGRITVDESLLSGESHEIAKSAGDQVYSGTFCTTGSATFEATRVGESSLANQLTATARAFRRVLTPLQKQVYLVVRLILLVALTLGIVLFADSVMTQTPLVDSIKMLVVVAGLVPNGLFLAMAIAYALAAVRMAGRGVLTQQANAVESLSHVDTLCLDKTGTLTTGRIRLHGLHPIGANEADLRQQLGDFVASATAGNRTADALAAACPGVPHQPLDEVPFSSARRWSASVLDGPAGPALFVLGAPEALLPCLTTGQGVLSEVERFADSGLRVLLFARHPQTLIERDPAGEPVLPTEAEALGLITLQDELRPGARAALEAFASSGVAVKLLSGDHPRAVRALLAQIGFAADSPMLTGAELASVDSAEVGRVAAETTVFGRVDPYQKEQIVAALHARGQYVGMLGDGVNDVLALKRADLAIAVQSGSQAARAVADLVLLDDSFDVLPAVVGEGQRIVRGQLDILRLFLVRVLYTALLIAFVGVIDGGFPLAPRHNAVLALFTVGLPTLALAAWARPEPVPPGGVLRWLSHFVVPAAWSLAVLGFMVYLLVFTFTRDILLAQTTLTTLSVFCGLLLVAFAEPPISALTGGAPLSRDARPAMLACALLVAYLAVLTLPAPRRLFDLLAILSLGWGLAVRWIWRQHWLERLVQV